MASSTAADEDVAVKATEVGDDEHAGILFTRQVHLMIRLSSF